MPDLIGHLLFVIPGLTGYLHKDRIILRTNCHARPNRASRQHSVEFPKAARYISPEYHEELEKLIEDLDLEFWGVERIESPTPDASSEPTQGTASSPAQPPHEGP